MIANRAKRLEQPLERTLQMVRKYKRKLIYGLFFFGLILVLLLYHTESEKTEQKISQKELAWNTAEELQRLSDIENRVARAKNGYSEIIPVSSTASGYEGICPQMQVSEKQEIQQNENKKTAYLTFDDGPSRQTGAVLDILERYQIKASFFVVAQDLTESGKEALIRAASEGHVIGMHSGTHEYKKIYDSVEALLKDYDKVFCMIRETTGQTPVIYRFPGGSYNTIGRECIKKAIPEMERRGFVCFDWNVSAEDAVGTPTASSIRKNIFENLDRVTQPVILMHDGSCNGLTVEVLPGIIEELMRRGYAFDTLDHREPYQFNW